MWVKHDKHCHLLYPLKEIYSFFPATTISALPKTLNLKLYSLLVLPHLVFDKVQHLQKNVNKNFNGFPPFDPPLASFLTISQATAAPEWKSIVFILSTVSSAIVYISWGKKGFD